MATNYSINSTLVINITDMDKRIGEYISNPDNWCEAPRNSLWNPDSADEFSLLQHKSIEDFDKFIIDNEYSSDYDEDSINFVRMLVLELLETKEDLSKVTEFYINMSW